MLVFLDFEASSLGERSYPIEVAWVFADGTSEAHLIRPAPDWDDWDPESQAIHGIARATLEAEGTPHDRVAQRMIAALGGHDLRASAPSWDGKWLSRLLRAAGLPRHSLRLKDSDDALAEAAATILRTIVPADALAKTVAQLVAETERAPGASPAHRALADAREEHARWLAVTEAAKALAAGH